MIQKELVITLIVLAIIAAFLYGKMILIWKDVMLKQNDKNKKDLERLRYLQKHLCK